MWAGISTASTASPSKTPATPGSKPMSRTSDGSASTRPTGSAPPKPMCGSRSAWITSARRRCAARALAAAAKPSKWQCMSTRRASRRRIKVGTLPDMGPRRYNLAAGLRTKSRKKKSDPMTYCCGILVRDGLVMIADTRTNAGLDNVSTFRKLHVFTKPGERIMAIASAGNLAISQSLLSTLTEGLEDPHTGGIETLMNAPTMFKGAQRIARTVRNVQNSEGKALEAAEVEH